MAASQGAWASGTPGLYASGLNSGRVPVERPKRSVPPGGGPQPRRVGAQARGMLGSVKMEAHDLAEWSYYPEAGEVCPRGWRSGKWGAGVGLRA